MAALTVVAATARPVAAPAPKNIIVIQPNSPVGITEYKAGFEQTNMSSGIIHNVSYTNRGRSRISAVRIGIVSFDVFNGFMGRIDGVSMMDVAVGRSGRGNWTQTPSAAFSFLTSVAYVDTVRYEDGTIWQADAETVLEELRKIDKTFDAKLLKAPVQ